VAIVVPALNEAGTIADVVAGASPFGQVIVVDDGSTDGTAEVARGVGGLVVRHDENQGYDGALRSGLAAAATAGFEAVVTMDADAQHEPQLLSRFVEPLDAGADLVLGRRSSTARAAETAFNAFTRTRYGIPDILCGMKGYRISLYDRHGRWLDQRSIGTAMALAAVRAGVAPVIVEVSILPRSGATRFGSGVRANARIARALGLALAAELRRK
jgi:glycosyltransferase involved in cell wall biosynthesis